MDAETGSMVFMHEKITDSEAQRIQRSVGAVRTRFQGVFDRLGGDKAEESEDAESDETDIAETKENETMSDDNAAVQDAEGAEVATDDEIVADADVDAEQDGIGDADGNEVPEDDVLKAGAFQEADEGPGFVPEADSEDAEEADQNG